MPITPHISHHLWQILGFSANIMDEEWPKVHIKALSTDNLEIMIQLNGKLRGKVTVPSDADNTILAYSTLNYLKITDSGTITGNEFDGNTQFFSQVSVGGGIGIDINATSANIMINNKIMITPFHQ